MQYAILLQRKAKTCLWAGIFLCLSALEAGPYLKIQKIYTEDFPYVRAEVSVSDITPLENLDQSSFEVFENDWKVGFFQVKKTLPEETPKNVAILIDASKSLSQEDFEAQISAVESFTRSLNEGDKVALISFHDSVEVRCGFTSSKEQIQHCIHSTKRNGQNTVLYDGIHQAASLFSHMPEERNYMILFTDGREEGSAILFEDLLRIVQESGVTVFSVATGSRKKLTPMARLSHLTGGEIYLSASITNLGKIYMLLGQLFDTTYTIQYISQTGGSLAQRLSGPTPETKLEIRFHYKEKNDQAIRAYQAPGFSLSGIWRNAIRDERALLFLWGLLAIIILLLILIFMSAKKKKPAAQDPLIISEEDLAASHIITEPEPAIETPQSYSDKMRETRKERIIREPALPGPGVLPRHEAADEEFKRQRDEYGKAYLVEKHGPHTGQKYRFKWNVMTIGHADENSIALDDPTVSYRHAKISYKEGEFFLYDLISENGVYLNGKKILRPKILQDFDEIGIGRSILLFRKTP